MCERPRIVCSEQTCADLYEALDDIAAIIDGNDLAEIWLNYPDEPAFTPKIMINEVLSKARGEANDYQY